MEMLIYILGIEPFPGIHEAWVWAAAAAAAALYGAQQQKRANREANAANYLQSKEFAQKGIRWKVNDARKAGIAPEFALGASTHSPSFATQPDQTGNMIADAGQNISRAALAEASQPDRQMSKALQVETLRGMKLDNDIKEGQGQASVGYPQNPAFPSANGNVIPGQGNSPVVMDKALERTGQSRNAPYSEGAAIPSVGWSTTKDGGLRPVPSQDIKNRIEDQVIPETAWAAQHLVAPNFGKGAEPPKEALPPKAIGWKWSVSRQAYYPLFRPKDSSYMTTIKDFNKHGYKK